MGIDLPCRHIPVLTTEVVNHLLATPGGRYIDATVGCGGHALALLTSDDSIQLIGIDRDPEAIEVAKQRLANFGERVCFQQENFSLMTTIANDKGWETVDGILLDLGVSSLQIETPARGFSFQQDSRLDMRMNQQDRISAFDLLNTLSENDLVCILRQYGEEPRARKIAAAIIAARKIRPLTGTQEFADLIRRAVNATHTGYSPTIARCFQAIRIAVNRELSHLKNGLDAAVTLLHPGGRIVVISFHSLEDRMVKNKFRFEAARCVCPPDLPVCQCGKKVRLRVLTKKPVTAGVEELARNARSRPAKLRAAEKV